MNNQDTKQWRAWVIKRNRYESVIGYIRDNIPEIDKYFYPLVKKEYQTKQGSRIKDRPLYEGYLFVRYHDHDEVFYKMSRYPFVTTYAGLVSEDEISRMQDIQGKLLTEIKASRFSVGETISLLEGPFKGFEGVVAAINGDVVKVTIAAKILGKGVEMFFQEDVLAHKTKLQNIEVQDI